MFTTEQFASSEFSISSFTTDKGLSITSPAAIFEAAYGDCALREFKEGAVRVLVATDIAARGIDIDQLPQVVNYDLPQVAEDYVHRIGRTGRAGAEGYAYSLVSADEADLLFEIERLIQKHMIIF